jgi:hypothetical protein
MRSPARPRGLLAFLRIVTLGNICHGFVRAVHIAAAHGNELHVLSWGVVLS